MNETVQGFLLVDAGRLYTDIVVFRYSPYNAGIVSYRIIIRMVIMNQSCDHVSIKRREEPIVHEHNRLMYVKSRQY